MNQAATPRRPDEHGVPDPFPYMHPTLKANYGNWAWHDRPRPGVLHHVAKNGEDQGTSLFKIEDITEISVNDIDDRRRLLLYNWRKASL